MRWPALLGVVAVLALVPGCSDGDDNRAPVLSAAPATVPAGGQVVVVSDGLDDLTGSRLSELKQSPLAVMRNGSDQLLKVPGLTIDDRGAFRRTITLPADAAPGKWTVSWDVPCHDTNASCVGVSADFTVVRP